ncbi:MAG: zinc ribbon domain-containing protein [Planctomycetes bacterium]|nr:zinc ribbon domain-containing protein [Planctomycetota bacterium]
MPTYEYACPSCRYKFEEFHSITAKPVKVCPKCKGRKVKRLISAGAGLIFKGSGFYLTDYRGKKGSDSSPAPSEATKPETKAETKAESKPAATTESKPAASEPAKTASKSAKKK